MKHTLIFLLALSLLLTFTSCRHEMSADAVLSAMCLSQPILPAGQVYLSSASPGEKEFADEELLAVLFGDGLLPVEFEAVNAFALRLSGFAMPYEFAVFACVSSRDAYDVAQMCLRRTDQLRQSCRGTAFETIADSAQVCVIGKYVLLAAGEDTETAIEAGRRAMRGK